MKTFHVFLTGIITTVLFTSNAISVQGEARFEGGEREREGPAVRVDRELRGLTNRAKLFRSDEIVVKLAGSERPLRVPVGGMTVEQAMREYGNRAGVEYAEPNFLAHAFAVPNDPYYQYQWNFDNAVTGGVNAESAWDITQGNGVVVAVIDTGVAYENYQSGLNRYYLAPDLAGTSFVGGYDFVDDDTHANDENGHGTHVAGTIAGATGNGAGVAGLAYRASVMPIKVLDRNGSGTYYDVADAIRYAADHGAKVINLSLGGPSTASYLEEALAYAHSKGVTIVAASGNDGASNVSYPAAYDKYVIAVGATRFDETRAYYSNYGVALDLVAPGGDINVDQNGDGYGDGILQQTFSGGTNSFNYFYYQGTSMATPHVAAAAAMVIANGVTAPEAVRARLTDTADDLGPTGRDNTYGHGLLNIAAALGVASSSDPDPEPVDTPPLVAISAPVAGATVAGEVMIQASTSDDVGIARVEFLVDGNTIKVATSAPYRAAWNTIVVINGTHTLKTVAYDTAGQTATAEISVVVKNVASTTEEVVVLADSFESGLAKWTQDSQRDWFLSTQRASEGIRSAEVDGRASDSALISPTINLGAGRTKARINFFWLIEEGFDAGEYIAFDVSTNGGLSWTERARLRGDVDPEETWQAVNVTVTGVSSIRVRYRAMVSGSTEDANIDAVSVVAY